MTGNVTCFHVLVAAGAEDVSWCVRSRVCLTDGAVAARGGACFRAVWEVAEGRACGSPECPRTDVDDILNHPKGAGCCLPHVVAHSWDAQGVHDLLIYVCGGSFACPVGQVWTVVIYVFFDCRREVRHEGGSGREAWESSDEARPGRQGGEVVRRNVCAVIFAIVWVVQGIRCPRVSMLIAMDSDVGDHFL